MDFHSLRIQSRFEGTSAVVGLIGDFDAPDVPDFHREMERLQSGGTTCFVVDLRQVSFFGCHACLALSDAGDSIAVKGGSMSVASARPLTAFVLHEFGLPSGVALFESSAVAIASNDSITVALAEVIDPPGEDPSATRP